VASSRAYQERRQVFREPRPPPTRAPPGHVRRAREERRPVPRERNPPPPAEPLPTYVPPTSEQRTAARSISRRIVQSWVDRNLTPGIEKLCESHRRCNPEYEYVFYDDKECRDFIKKHFHVNVLHAYDAIIPGAFKADLFRYCELYVNGGWWFDIDTMSVGAIDSIIGPEVEFACPRDIEKAFDKDVQYALYQAVLGCGPRHPVLEAAIRKIVDRVSQRSEKWAAGQAAVPELGLTGPALLGEEVNLYLGKGHHSTIRAGPAKGGRVQIGRSSPIGGRLYIGRSILALGHSQSASAKDNVQSGIHLAYDELKRRARGAQVGWTGCGNTSYAQPNPLIAASEQGRLGEWKTLEVHPYSLSEK
jgi:hypothetical protein